MEHGRPDGGVSAARAHPDLEKFVKEVNRAHKRFEKLCAVIAERLSAAQACQDKYVNYQRELRQEKKWLGAMENRVYQQARLKETATAQELTKLLEIALVSNW